MKFRPLYNLSVIALLLTMSCETERVNYDPGTGRIDIAVNIDTHMKEVDGGKVSDAVFPTPPTMEDFKVWLSDKSGQYSHTWESVLDFDPAEPYLSGEYSLSVYNGLPEKEGFDCPSFVGEAQLTVSAGRVSSVDVTCSLANSMFVVDYSDAVCDFFSDITMALHSPGGEYISYPRGETRPLYLQPGDISMIVSFTMKDGKKLNFQPCEMTGVRPGWLYHISVDIVDDGVPALKISCPVDERPSMTEVSLTDEFINGEVPVATLQGVSENRMSLPEGGMPVSPVVMDVDAPGGIGSMMLTTVSSTLCPPLWPTEMELLNPSSDLTQLWYKMGLSVSMSDAGGTSGQQASIDFSRLLSTLRYDPSSPETDFILVVRDRMSRVCEPIQLTVVTGPVDFEIIHVRPSTVGVNRAQVVVSSGFDDFEDNLIVEVNDVAGKWTPATVNSVTAGDEPSQYVIDFNIPDGTGDVDARIVYCGTVKATFTVRRVSPAFSIDIDAFARYARIRVVPKDEVNLKTITSWVSVYADGMPLSVLERDDDNGILTVVGLKPGTRYNFTATVMSRPGLEDFTEPVAVTTEDTPALPNGDFEEVKETVKFVDMPSGGRYSQNTVEIYNRQNTIDYALSTPVKGWATTNDKTFNLKSRRHNTWYMQPSVFSVFDAQSGGYAVQLQSVAFDPDGPEIPDWLQEGRPYVNYSRAVPDISYRAAGKMFLGEYYFDVKTMSERYAQGMGFKGRPTALNGFYRYTPCTLTPNDRGLVVVKVYGMNNGEETVIASGRLTLPAATGYTAFSLPLSYPLFGARATRLEVMVSSTVDIGDVAEETSRVVTLPDPVTSSSVGSRLWIDNLSFAY